MIPVQRVPKPNVLQKREVRWLKELQEASDERQRVESNPQSTEQDIKRAKRKVDNAQNKYRHEEIKNTLVEMFHGKCAYCESKIEHVSCGDAGATGPLQEACSPESEYSAFACALIQVVQ